MQKFLGSVLVVCVCLLIQPDVWADLVRMKNGQLFEGKFLGCAADAIQIQTAQGIVTCPIQEILSITFLPTSLPSSQETDALPQTTPHLEKTPAPQSTPKPLIIVPGTRLRVRLLNAVDTIQSKTNDWFTVTLDAALVLDGLEVVPKGAPLRGQVVQSEQGRYGSALVITLRQLLLQQQVLPIVTTAYTAWDKPPQTVDDSSVRRQRTLRIPAETLLEFKITDPIKLERSK